MTSVDGLIAFLRTRLDEDGQVARAASAHPEDDGRWTAGSENWQAERIDGAGITIYDEGGHTAEQAAHIARWDPARVLAEVEAKRRIVTHHGMLPDGACQVCWLTTSRAATRREWPCPTVRLLVVPYAGHPDYREEWRP